MKKFDLIIIGGGAGAFAAAIRANELKARTAMINAGLPLGGTCVNVGCVPSKTLLWAGEVLHQAKHHGIPGIEFELKRFDFRKVVQDELSLVEKLRREKYEKVLKNLEYVTAIEGRAKFVSRNEVDVGGEKLGAEKFIVAVGSTATVPPIPGIREAGFLTHIEALKLQHRPESLVVIGAGPLGLEFSQMFARFGTKVTILQRGPRIFPAGEKELTARLAEVLVKEGIVIKTNVEVKSVRKVGEGKRVVFDLDSKREEIIAEEILLAAGKTPNTEGLGLEKVGVEVDERRAVIVNQHLRTSNKSIFAVGDVVSAPLRLETTAGREGTLAAENALRLADARSGQALNSIDYNSVPYTIFTDPQLAGVGLTEEAQVTVSFSDLPKAVIMRRTEGMIKMVVHPKTKQILGVHILGPNAGELIASAMILVKNKNTIDDLVNSLPMFPTLSEALKIAALSFRKDISKLSCCI
jgi:mercuric reductase